MWISSQSQMKTHIYIPCLILFQNQTQDFLTGASTQAQVQGTLVIGQFTHAH